MDGNDAKRSADATPVNRRAQPQPAGEAKTTIFTTSLKTGQKGKMAEFLENSDDQRIFVWPWLESKLPFPSIENESSKDPRTGDQVLQRRVTLNDISAHHNEYVNQWNFSQKNFEKPLTELHRTGKVSKEVVKLSKRPATPPSTRVQFLLGPDVDGFGHEIHPIFAELDELMCNQHGNLEWKETARWVKFEEDVESGGERWSKPHVATLSLHSLFELRNLLSKGAVILDMEASNLEEISDILMDNLVNSNILTNDKRCLIKDAIMKNHRHQFRHGLTPKPSDPSSSSSGSFKRSLTESLLMKHTASVSNLLNFVAMPIGINAADIHSTDNLIKWNHHFMKKIPKESEVSNILVGELDGVDCHVSAFIRLRRSLIFENLTEVPLPTRFIFILLGPPGKEKNVTNAERYHEIGRAMATSFSDEVFQTVAYRAKNPKDILAGIDEFLDSVTVIPPGEWDPSIRIEPPSHVQSQEGRKQPPTNAQMIDEEELRQKLRQESGLVRSGRLFGGFIDDVKRKLPYYKSDFTDGPSFQSLGTIIFMYFACLAPVVTFGGLLEEATEGHIGVTEALVGGMLVGVSYGLLSGQPLSILGPTGPILVFEKIVFDMCTKFGWDYLPHRFCIGIWVAIILLVGVATDASALVCYITRFTEENFALLIAVIFIKSAFEKLVGLYDEYPLHDGGPCFCAPSDNSTENFATNFTAKKGGLCSFLDDGGMFVDGNLSPAGCGFAPNVFLASLTLFCGTFAITMMVKKFRETNFFPTAIRGVISDFAVVIALVAMTAFDAGLAVDTPKLQVPPDFSPTLTSRSWIINPLGPNNPWWAPIFAFVPAMLATILVFMDQQITVVIVNRKEHLLRKGCGYHLDLFVVAIMVFACSMFGMPWCEASTVPSINHVRSLTLESESSAPGEKRRFLGIREQRLTHVVIFILIGLSVFMAPMLSYIPMPVLFGLFLYMGVASLSGLQMFDRVLLFLMPKKYQPDSTYLRRVPLLRVHMFTFIQVACLLGLWIVKDTATISILFPIMLIVMVGVRKGLEFLFTTNELKILDDILPSLHRSEQLDDEDKRSLHRAGSVKVTMNNGNVLSIPISSSPGETSPQHSTEVVNISEELTRTGVWKSLPGNGEKTRKRKMKRKNGGVDNAAADNDDDGGLKFDAVRPEFT